MKTIKINSNKIKKLWFEHGATIVFKEIFHFAAKKMARPAAKITLANRDLLFKNLNMDLLTQDMENVFSNGLLRPLGEVIMDVRSLPKRYAESVLKEAGRILQNEFTLYGNLKVSYGPEQFSWTRDPLTDFVWPETMTGYSGYNGKINKPYRTDIKTVWEIARFQFLTSLAYAYILSGEERYARFAIDKVKSWIDENPFQHGPHWMMPMESAIRLINWCVYLPLLEIFKFTDLSYKNKITQSILDHLIFIRYNLEISPSMAGNHYLADLVSLLLARLLCPSLEWATESTEFAIEELEREIQRQFGENGINFEGSLSYHRLSFEMCLMGAALIKKNGLGISPRVLERLKKIAYFTRYYTSISDESPIIGDNDSGIFVRFFSDQELNRHGYLSCLFNSILGNRRQPKDFEEFLCSIHFTQVDPPDDSGSETCNKTSGPSLQVRDLDGLIIARDGSDALYFNTLKSSLGHTHNDKLSIYPVFGGKLLFIDRGSFSYTGFWRKRHEDRMSASHNSPLINDWEQNTIWKNALFYNQGEAKCYCSTGHSDSILSITGCHIGYERFRKGLKVFRQIHWNIQQRKILIADWLEGKSSNEMFQLKLYFLINPIWSVKVADGGFIFSYQGQTVYFEDKDLIGFELVQGCYCPNYQIEKRCEALKASFRFRVGNKVRYRLSY